MVAVPDVVGDSVDDAKKTLEDAGFEVEEDRGLLGLFGDTVKSSPWRAATRRPRGRRSRSRSAEPRARPGGGRRRASGSA